MLKVYSRLLFYEKKKLDLERSEMQGKENVLYKLLLEGEIIEKLFSAYLAC